MMSIEECVKLVEEDLRRTEIAIQNKYKPDYFNKQRQQSYKFIIQILSRLNEEFIVKKLEQYYGDDLNSKAQALIEALTKELKK